MPYGYSHVRACGVVAVGNGRAPLAESLRPAALGKGLQTSLHKLNTIANKTCVLACAPRPTRLL
eukprot:4780731-Prymnesium_polylepis.1